jgi:uncharacterized protein (DUF2062 family)/trans-aconitate methyltransferase
MGGAAAAPAEKRQRGDLRIRLRELLYQLRVEGGSPGRQGGAVALGIFIGCTPLYGLHLPLCIVFARLFGLNRLLTYLAAHISTPILLPFLLFAEIQVGRLLRGARLLPIRPGQLRQDFDFWHWRAWGGDLLVGSLVVGVVLGGVLGLLTYWLLRRGRRPPAIEALIEQTSHRYIAAGLWHTEYVRGKLRHDPVYFHLLEAGLLPRSGLLLDLGCGRAIPFAAVATAAEQTKEGTYPAGWPPAPELERMELHGIESRPKVAAVARQALPPSTVIEVADLRRAALPAADAILLVDVLHYLSGSDQQELLRRAAQRLQPGGTLFLREADAAATWRFLRVRLGERLSATLRGRWRQRFRYRAASVWIAMLQSEGLHAELHPVPGKRSANVLIVARRQGAKLDSPA